MSDHSQIMETIDIANGAFSVSRIGLGTWAIGGWMWGGTDERQSIETIHAAVDRGVTLFDTAPVYGFGRAEEILGKALAQDNRRARVAIATKVGLDWRDSTPFRDASKKRIVKEVEDSLRRLQTDVIDLYQVHWPDPDTPTGETAAAMAELYRARQNTCDWRQQFQSGADGRVSRERAAARRAAAL
jgi:aryl-alcohol dehydrogenase-like predicted oxidoreductase